MANENAVPFTDAPDASALAEREFVLTEYLAPSLERPVSVRATLLTGTEHQPPFVVCPYDDRLTCEENHLQAVRRLLDTIERPQPRSGPRTLRVDWTSPRYWVVERPASKKKGDGNV